MKMTLIVILSILYLVVGSLVRCLDILMCITTTPKRASGFLISNEVYDYIYKFNWHVLKAKDSYDHGNRLLDYLKILFWPIIFVLCILRFFAVLGENIADSIIKKVRKDIDVRSEDATRSIEFYDDGERSDILRG